MITSFRVPPIEAATHSAASNILSRKLDQYSGFAIHVPSKIVIAIEPMLNVGDWDTRQLDDGWTVVTADGTLSAHFEDTIAITEDGIEVFTSPKGYDDF